MDKTTQVSPPQCEAEPAAPYASGTLAYADSSDRPREPAHLLWVVDDDSMLCQWLRLTLKPLMVDARPLSISYLHPARLLQAVPPKDLALLVVAVNTPDAQPALRLLRQLRTVHARSNLRLVLVAANSSCVPSIADLELLDVGDCWLRDELDRGRIQLRVAACMRQYQQLAALQRSEHGLRCLFAATQALSRAQGAQQQHRQTLAGIENLLGHAPQGAMLVSLQHTAADDAELRVLASSSEPGPTVITAEVEAQLRAAARARRTQGDRCSRVFVVEGGDGGECLLCYVRDREPLSPQTVEWIEQLMVPLRVAHRAEESLRGFSQRALTDAQLALPNQIALVQRLQQLIDASATTHQLLMLIDIDRFSEINLSFGFDYGDELLRAVAAALTGSLGPTVTVARLHDDVMALLGDERELSVAGVRDALRTASVALGRLRIHTARHRLTGYRGSAERALAAAALQIKMSKRGEVAADSEYTPLREQPFGRARKLLSQLREDLDAQRIAVHYQPQVDLASGQVVALEALARWRGRDGETISPAVFIPLAERSGDIVQLGHYVLRRACHDLMSLRQQHGATLRLAVNCSASQFAAPDFVRDVLATLEHYGLPPQQFEVEVTESVAMQDIDAVQQRIDALREAGVHMALDDFGTGFSSLMYLRRLKFDCIKIDRSFVLGLGRSSADSEGDGAIADLIIRLARRLGCRVIGEGVENHEQMHWLLRHGCRLVQGYGIGSPMPLDELIDWLRQRV